MDDFIPNSIEVQACRKNSKFAAELAGKEDVVEETYRRLAADDFMTFTLGLTIKYKSTGKQFSRVIADFQRRCFEDIAPNITALRDGDRIADVRRFWIERTKKGGKDSDLAVIIAWLCAFPKRPFYGQIGAADREQASIVKERLSDILHYNPWLNDLIELTGNQIRSKKTRRSGHALCRFDIKSSDVAGAHGGTPELMVINELSHIVKFEFAENMMDNASGVPEGMAIIATNAGYAGTPAHRWRNDALTSENWSVHILTDPAPWHTREDITAARRRNSKSRFMRLWRGRWVDSSGDAFDPSDIDAMFCLDGPQLEPVSGWTYLAGLDLGISHDHSGLVLVGVNQKIRKIRVCYFRRWTPADAKNRKVDLMVVEEECLAMAKKFNLLAFYYDPWQAELMAQRLKQQGVNMRQMPFQSTTKLHEMATKMKEVIESNVLQSYDDSEATLRADIGKLNIVEKSYGYRLEAAQDESGHADVAMALITAIPGAVELLQGGAFGPEDNLTDLDDSDLSELELEDMPKELRQIYDLDDQYDIKEVEEYFSALE